MIEKRSMKRVVAIVMAMVMMLGSVSMVQAVYYEYEPEYVGEGYSYESEVESLEVGDYVPYTYEPEKSTLVCLEGEEPGFIVDEIELGEMYQLLPPEGSSLESSGAHVSKAISNVSDLGNYIDVNLTLDTNPGLLAVLADIVFDKAVLTPVSIVEGRDLQNFDIVLPPIDGGRYPGRLKFLATDISAAGETGLIATIRFRLAGGISRNLPIVLGYLEMIDNNESGEIVKSTASASHAVLSQHSLQSFEPLSAPMHRNVRPINDVWLGDLNGDERVTSLDTTHLALFLVDDSHEIIRRNADVIVDGFISMDDLTHMSRWLVGQHVPVGPPLNSITILPYRNGLPLYNAHVEVWVNNVRRFNYPVTSGIISFPNIGEPWEQPIRQGDRVQYRVRAGAQVLRNRTITSFNYERDGIQTLRPITMQNVIASRGSTVRLPIMLDWNPGLTSSIMRVHFDPERLRIANPSAIARGTALSDLSFMTVNGNLQSYFTAMWMGTQVDNTTGSLLNVNFTVRDNAPLGKARVRVEVVDAYNFPIPVLLPVQYGYVIVR